MFFSNANIIKNLQISEKFANILIFGTQGEGATFVNYMRYVMSMICLMSQYSGAFWWLPTAVLATLYFLKALTASRTNFHPKGIWKGSPIPIVKSPAGPVPLDSVYTQL